MSPNLLMTEYISDFQFVDIGTIKTVYGEGKRIDVLLPYKRPDKQEDLLHCVELLQYGNAVAKVTIPPQIGDVVLVFLPHSSIADAQAKAEPEQRKISYYNPIGYKANLFSFILKSYFAVFSLFMKISFNFGQKYRKIAFFYFTLNILQQKIEFFKINFC